MASFGSKKLGFTLLEVMIAIAILGISLAAIFSSEAGAIKTATRARHTNAATLLARCKLAELEEKIMREGLPAISAEDDDECCEDAELEGFRCTWKIERVVLPDATEDSENALASATNGTPPAGGGDSPGANPSTIDSLMSGQASAADMAGGNLATLGIQLVYPVLKPTIEEQVRRATVTVLWKEGSSEKSFNVVQYLVSNGPAIPDPNAIPTPTQ